MSSKIDRFGGKRNYSKRTGRVVLGLRRAALVDPDREWSTSELMQWTHTMPLHRSGNSSHVRLTASRSIRRACQKLAIRVGRSEKGTGRPVLWKLRRPLP
jgi:hypothetical protein